MYQAAGVVPQDGCLELLTGAPKPYGIVKGNIPDPLNVHYDVRNGMLLIDEPVSRPGDYIELSAEMDCLVALSGPDDAVSL
jgi:uncharacterized protein YcgI (DUF1989 family)